MKVYNNVEQNTSRFSPDAIPAEMKQQKHWCVYGRRSEKWVDAENKNKQGNLKLDKIPYNPITGKAASSNKPETWATFEEATASYNRGMVNGVGYFFNYADDSLAGIDIDHKFSDGVLDDDAREIINHFPDTYIELSPSGDGLHIYCLGMPLKCGKGNKNKWLEIYGRDVQGKSSNRYFCVTGNVFETAPSKISDGQAGLAWIYENFKETKPRNQKPKSTTQSSSTFQSNPSDEAQKVDNALTYISPDSDYQNWLNVGMALHSSEYGVDVWDRWSATSAKYNQGECESKWNSFSGNSIGIGTLFELAKQGGYEFPKSSNPISSSNQNASWEIKLKRDRFDAVKKTKLNVKIILTNHSDWKGIIAHNSFTHQINKITPPPFPHSPNDGFGEWTDADNVLLGLWLSENYGIEIASNILQEIIVAVALGNAFNPVQDYLESCHSKWIKAGKPNGHATSWVEKHLGAKESPATRIFQKAWIISAVARVYEPGCKVDNVLILEGAQGLLKSTALSVLGGEWFSDTTIDFADKDSIMLIHENWIIEMPELDKFKKSDSDRAKSFFARQKDKYRAPYGHNLITKKRQCVFAGTTNTEDYLKDSTGNRRYMPIKCLKKCDLKSLENDRDLIWGEAVELYKSGEQWWYDNTLQYVQDAQNQRFAEDVWQDVIETYLGLHPKGVTIQMILNKALRMDLDRCGKLERCRVADILRKAGWRQSYHVIVEGIRKKGWIPST